MSTLATATATPASAAIPPAPPASGGLPLAGLEQTYDALALAIDAAPAGRSELMLVKLALLLAHEVGDAARVQALIDTALRDL
jgi:hypothetical protein